MNEAAFLPRPEPVPFYSQHHSSSFINRGGSYSSKRAASSTSPSSSSRSKLLDLNLALSSPTGVGGLGREALYPSPPMSGSPPSLPPQQPPSSSSAASRIPRSSAGDQGEDYSSILSRPDPSELFSRTRQQQQAQEQRERAGPGSFSSTSTSRPPLPPLHRRQSPPLPPALSLLREPEPTIQLPSIAGAFNQTQQQQQQQQRPSLPLPTLSPEATRRTPFASSGPPSRVQKTQRPTKTHTPSACQHCRHKHLKCEAARPCSRCIQKGLQDTCIDKQHKKRGRPRLRDDSQTSPTTSGPGYRPAPNPVQPFLSPLESPHGRQHRSFPPPTSFSPSRTDSTSSLLSFSSANTAPPIFQPLDASLGPPPVAFLTLDLHIVKASPSFRSMLGYSSQDLANRTLKDITALQGHHSLDRLRDQLEKERDEREPTALPLLQASGAGVRDAVSLVQESDHAAVSSSFQDRIMSVSFRLPTGQSRLERVLFKLARTSVYFAVLTLLPGVDISPRRLATPFPPSASAYAQGPPSASTQFSPILPSPRPHHQGQHAHHSNGSSAPASPYYISATPFSSATPRFDYPPPSSSAYPFPAPPPGPASSSASGRLLPHARVPSLPSPSSAAPPLLHSSSSSSASRRSSGPGPSIIAAAPAPTRRRTSTSELYEHHHHQRQQQMRSMEELQLPPIRETAAEAGRPQLTATGSTLGRRRRGTSHEEVAQSREASERRQGSSGVRDGGGEEDEQGGGGDEGGGRRKRARIDVKEVMD